ncbi:MAG: hypothetical protein ACLP8X_38625 [Streptosporangiaceae bacterium]
MRTRSWPSGRRTVMPGTELPHPCGELAACAVHEATKALSAVASALLHESAAISGSAG